MPAAAASLERFVYHTEQFEGITGCACVCVSPCLLCSCACHTEELLEIARMTEWLIDAVFECIRCIQSARKISAKLLRVSTSKMAPNLHACHSSEQLSRVLTAVMQKKWVQSVNTALPPGLYLVWNLNIFVYLFGLMWLF